MTEAEASEEITGIAHGDRVRRAAEALWTTASPQDIDELMPDMTKAIDASGYPDDLALVLDAVQSLRDDFATLAEHAGERGKQRAHFELIVRRLDSALDELQ